MKKNAGSPAFMSPEAAICGWPFFDDAKQRRDTYPFPSERTEHPRQGRRYLVSRYVGRLLCVCVCVVCALTRSKGVTLYCLLRGRLPFEAENPLDLYESIRDDPYVSRCSPHFMLY